MVPMRPTACSNWLVSLVTWLDGHIRCQSLCLPLGKILGDQLFHLAFAHEVGFSHRGEIGNLPRRIDGLLGDPLDCVEALLKDVIGSWIKLIFLPTTQAIAGIAIRITEITAQRLDRCATKIPYA